MGRKGLSNHHWIVGGKLCVRILWNRAISSVAARAVRVIRVSNSPRLCRRCPTRISWCSAISATYPSRFSRLLAHPAIMRVAGDDSPLRPDTHRRLLSNNGVARTLSMVGLPTSLAQRLVGGTVRWPDPRSRVARRGMPRRRHTAGATACRCSRGKLYGGRCRPPGRALHCRRHIDAACYTPSLRPRHPWHGPHTAPPAAARGCTWSWKAFPAVKVGTAFAGIGIVSPVRGFRPARAWR
jgi:hypothetical protein